MKGKKRTNLTPPKEEEDELKKANRVLAAAKKMHVNEIPVKINNRMTVYVKPCKATKEQISRYLNRLESDRKKSEFNF